jgi:hypothetical protein
MIETCWSDFKCFNVWHLNCFITNKCISWPIIYSELKCTVKQWKTKFISLSKLLVMSIFWFFVYSVAQLSGSELGCLMVEVSRSHRHTTIGSIPLDKGSALRRNLFSIVQYFKIIKRHFMLVIINKETYRYAGATSILNTFRETISHRFINNNRHLW